MSNFCGVETSRGESEELSLFDAEVHPSTINNSSECYAEQDDEITTGNTQLLSQFLDYHDIPSNPAQSAQEIDYLFRRFVSEQPGLRGLKLQFGSSSALLLNELWISMDLTPIEEAARAGLDVKLDFQDEQFDRVLCLDLDRVSRPVELTAELRRVLKRGGQLWGQAPVSIHQPSGLDSVSRYWGFTPDGFRVLFERFDEILCAMYRSSGSIKRMDSFFYGLKPHIPAE